METIPKWSDERTQNIEVYAQKKIYGKLDILNQLPIVQNVSGNFVNYISSDANDVIGDVISAGDGLDFNEIRFGEPSKIRGHTIPKGLMFKMNTRLEDVGRLEATLQVFVNKTVSTLANFYEKSFMDSLINGAGATAPSGLNTIDGDSTGIDVLENELKIIDAMEEKNGLDTGFTPNKVYLSRNDALYTRLALAKSNLLDDSNFEYVGTSAIPAGTQLVMDTVNPVATIEKYADPRYSFIAQLEQEPELNTEILTALPASLINIKMTEPEEPQRSYVYIFAEAGLNILEPNGVMKIQ